MPRGMNLQRKAKDGFARLMESFDLLLMPTVPLVAQPFPAADASIAEYCDHAWNMLANCPTYNYTGQPSMSVPCGTVDGLPVGLMITGRWWDEPTVYRAAAAFEANFDWRSLWIPPLGISAGPKRARQPRRLPEALPGRETVRGKIGRRR